MFFHIWLHFFILFPHFAEKERELGVVQSEIKSLRTTEAQKDKALEEVQLRVKCSNLIHLFIHNSENNMPCKCSTFFKTQMRTF